MPPGKEQATSRSICNRAANSSTAATPASWRCWSRPKSATRTIRWARGVCRAAAINCRSTSLEPIVRRQLAGAQLAGRVTVGLEGNWGDGAAGGDARVEGQVDVSRSALRRSRAGIGPIGNGQAARPVPHRGQGGADRHRAIAAGLRSGQARSHRLGQHRRPDAGESAGRAAARGLPDGRPARPGPAGGAVSRHAVAAAGNRNHGRRLESFLHQPAGRRRQQLDGHAGHQRFGSDGRRSAAGLETTAEGRISLPRRRNRLDRRPARLHVELSCTSKVRERPRTSRPRPISIWPNWPPSWAASSIWHRWNCRAPGRPMSLARPTRPASFSAKATPE